MKLDSYAKIACKVWQEQIIAYLHAVNTGSISVDPPGSKAIFPTTLLVTETSDSYISEMFGVSETAGTLNLVISRPKGLTTDGYLFQYSNPPDGSAPYNLAFKEPHIQPIIGIPSGKKHELAAICKRFRSVANFLKYYHERPFLAHEKCGPVSRLFRMQNDYSGVIYCDAPIFSIWNGIYKYKFVRGMSIIRKGYPEDALYIAMTKSLFAINNSRGSAGRIFPAVFMLRPEEKTFEVHASDLYSLALKDRLGETSITTYINDNPSVLLSVFGGQSVHPQVKFPYLVNAVEDGPESIVPDFIIKNNGGACDIIDFKRVKGDRDSLVTSRKTHMTYAKYVHMGIAQLRDYDQFFKARKHADAARRRGFVFNNPKLYLIVGNSDNLPVDANLKIKHSLMDRIHIIDYDTLANLLTGLPTPLLHREQVMEA